MLSYVVMMLIELLCCHSSCRFAYIEFADKESVQTSLALDDSLFRGRQIKVSNPIKQVVP